MAQSQTQKKPAVPQPGPGFDAKWRRVMDCVALRTPDRMPVVMQMHFWLAKYGGFSFRDQMYDYGRVKDASERFCREFQPDLFSSPILMTTIGPMLEAIDFKQVQWPGHGVGDHQPYQYLDREYMTPDEYDDFIFDPTGFYLEKYLPRVAGAFDGLQGLSSLTGLSYFSVGWGALAFADPRMETAFQRMKAASQVVADYMGHQIDLAGRLTAAGTPMGWGSVAVGPFDAIADYFRGAAGMLKDMYRHKDKMLAALDKMADLTIRKTLQQAAAAPNPIVYIPIHWAPDSFMSQKQFETFWWPSFRKLLIALIDAGLVPMPHWEHDCTKRLEIIRDIPAGKCIYWFERTDMVEAFEKLGDVVALRGGLPGSLLTAGKPEDIDAAVRHLVENVFEKGGKLMLDGAFGVPDETPLENVKTLFSAARKYSQ